MHRRSSLPLPTGSAAPHGRTLAALLLALALTTAACGGGGSQDFSQCGNGHIDAGEQCDDGNRDDRDGCTAVCRQARCGDGAVEVGVEQCDQFDLNSQGCESLGYGGASASLRCTASCVFDVSQCGPAFTPTATVTPTVFEPSPTPTATPPPIPCGDGLLQAGQTCEDCPADCVPAACEPTAERAKFTIVLDVPAAQTAMNTTVFLAYRSSVLSIPGTASDADVRRRIRPLAPLPQAFSVVDLDYAARLTARQPNGLNTEFATADFDRCAGSPDPDVSDLSCTIEACEAATGPISGCTCRVEPTQP